MEKYMTFEELVSKLFKQAREITLSEQDINLLHAATGICGEAGEVLDLVKKTAFNNRDLNYKKLIEELGDVEFYLEALRQTLGISREDILLQNIEKLGKRYPLGYSDQAALERADCGP